MDQISFNENKFFIVKQLSKLVVIYNLKNNYYTEMNAEKYCNAITEIKLFCINEQIKQFSIIRLEG